jgi:hypothetical protein
MSSRTAVILGASGSVGQTLLPEVVSCGGFSRILVMTRRPLKLHLGPQVEERLVPEMEPDKLCAIYTYPEMMSLRRTRSR